MNTWMLDIRFALRSLAKNPGFTLAAVLSLAIGIGANTSIFGVADALLLRPLPYENADRLVILWNRSPGLGITQDWFSTAQYLDIKASHNGFEQLAIAIGGNYNLTGQGDPERVGVMRVSSTLLPMLGARPALGRLLKSDEDSPGSPATAVLTYGMWARRFGRDPQMVGKSIIINGQTYEVVGILPQRFSLPQEVLPLLYGTEQAENFSPIAARAVRLACTRSRGLQHHREVEAGSVASASSGGDGYHHGAAAPRLSGELSAQRRVDVQYRTPSRTSRWRRPSLLMGATCFSGFCPADRLRQCRQPYAVASDGAPAGNCRAHRLGGGPMAYRSPTIDGERAAFAMRWSFGCLHLLIQR